MKHNLDQINNWFEQNKSPNLEQFDRYHETYVKIWIDPWFKIEKKNPPLSCFSHILEKFDAMYDLWKTEFANLNIPSDLQFWLFEKDYIKSELVCAKVDELYGTRENYFPRAIDKREFPAQKFTSKLFDPSKFEWQLFHEIDELDERIDDLSEKEIDDLLNAGYQREIMNGNSRFWKPVDYVWVGRKLQPTS